MRIGLLTFHYAHNYGAVLQAYALKSYLESLGHDVSFVDYKNTVISKVYDFKLHCKYSIFDFIHIRRIPKMIRANLDTIHSYPEWHKQWKAFESFIDRHLTKADQEKKESLSFDSFDVIIAGSDQIWNAKLTGGIDHIYFLDFETKAKKVFYGASNGSNSIPEEHAAYYRKVLTNVHWVSTRESTLADDIENSFGIHAMGVVDPSLLLERKDYERLIVDKPLNEKYIFAYFVTEDSVLMNMSRYLSRILNLPVIELHFYKTCSLKGKNQRADMGPEEFLWHIKNAEFILTNSFHGTVFALLFQKQFYSVYENDARKSSLLEALGCSNRHIYKFADIDLNDIINYNQVDFLINELRKPSKTFLYNSLDA